MKLAVICANGKEGRFIVKEAMDRGLDITAVGRGENRTSAGKYIQKDLFDLTASDLEPFDVVIDAFGVWTPEALPQHATSLRHLCNLVKDSSTRLLVVGGAGSLYMDPEHRKQLMDGVDFPDMFKPLAMHMNEALQELRTRKDVTWTYISPGADFQAEGPKTGSCRLGGEELILNAKGESVISYADFATAMVDEAVSGTHIQQRISVVAAS